MTTRSYLDGTSSADTFEFVTQKDDGTDKGFAAPDPNEPEPIALLLPAVQAAREAARGTDSGSDTSGWNVLVNNEPLGPWAPDDAGDPIPRYDFFDAWPIA